MNAYTKFGALLLALFISSGLNANTFFRTYDFNNEIEFCIGTIELQENGNIAGFRRNYFSPELDGIMFVNSIGDSISFSNGSIGSDYCVIDELDIVYTYMFSDDVYIIWIDIYCNVLKTAIIYDIIPYSYGSEDIIQTMDGGFLTCGDQYVLKVDSEGLYEWHISYEPYGPWYFYVVQGADGTYLAGGDGQFENEYCCNISEEGIIQWEWTSSEMYGYDAAAVGSPDGGYVVTRSNSSVLKLSASGDSLWCYTSINPNITYYDVIIRGTDILACGESWVDSLSVVTRLDSEGNLLWEREYDKCGIYKMSNTLDGGFILSGSYPSIPYTNDTASLIIKTDSEGWWGGTGTEPEHYVRDLDITVYPNPSSSFSVVSFTLDYSSMVNLSIFDAAGRLVMEYPDIQCNAGENEITVEGFGSGVYFCSINSGDFTATQRFVVIE
jgi:hypothetical protein